MVCAWSNLGSVAVEDSGRVETVSCCWLIWYLKVSAASALLYVAFCAEEEQDLGNYHSDT